jgi:hypothetical protein
MKDVLTRLGFGALPNRLEASDVLIVIKIDCLVRNAMDERPPRLHDGHGLLLDLGRGRFDQPCRQDDHAAQIRCGGVQEGLGLGNQRA